MSAPLSRILERVGVPDLVERLGERLGGADFTSLMLAVLHQRAARVRAPDVLKQYTRDRFVGAAPVPLQALRRVQDAAFARLPDGTEAIVLAPLMPLGAHSAVATVDQNKVVSTLRGTEVAADPTNALALEAAVRRQALGFDGMRVSLAACQRVVRAQALGGAARSFAHFEIFGMVNAGRDDGALRLEIEAAVQHACFHAALARACGAHEVEIALTAITADGERIVRAVREALQENGVCAVRFAPERSSGRGYYQHACFKSFARFADVRDNDDHGEDSWIEIGDGGDVDWTARLTSNGKERCFISGLGVDRLAMA